MNQKLSTLQQQILTQALVNKGKLSNRQALHQIYRFPKCDHPTAGVFCPSEIGIDRYRAATVTVVKSFNRLANRGLAERVYNHGIYLTKSGIRAAKEIGRGI